MSNVKFAVRQSPPLLQPLADLFSVFRISRRDEHDRFHETVLRVAFTVVFHGGALRF